MSKRCNYVGKLQISNFKKRNKSYIVHPVSVLQPQSFIWAASWQNQQNDCAPKEDSDQPGHPPNLIRVFAVTQWVAKDPSFLHEDSEDSDQTGRMPRLIWVFAGCTCHFVGFVMRRLICDVLVYSCDYFKVHQYQQLQNQSIYYFLAQTT